MKRLIKLLIVLGLGAWCRDLAAAGLQPGLPYPPNLASNIPANADLTWTPGDMELISNGGFEITNFTGWVRVNTGGGGGGANNNTYINDGLRRPFNGDIPYPPYAGNYCAVTDQDGPGLISIYQDVFVPSGVGSVWLTWADQIHNYFNTFVAEDPPQRQEYRVEVRAPNNNVLAVLYRTEPGDPVWTDWNKRSYDLSPYKGQTLRIAFVQEQWRNFFHLYYDNISVRIRDAGLVSYDVFFGTNAVPGTNEFRGTVGSASFALPQLRPQQTYYWRVNARFGSDLVAGPVWRFTTAPVGPLDHFTWAPIASPQAAGAAFDVAVTARDSAENALTNFASSVNVAAYNVTGIATNTLQGDVPPSVFASYENSTVGYSFTPNTDLVVLGFKPFAGGKVSLWTDGGVLLGSEPPIQLLANRTYRLGVYFSGVATNYLRFDGVSTFAHGTLNQSYEGSGDAFPDRPHPARWWLVDLIYAAPTISSSLFSEPASFSGGAWNGSISVAAAGMVELKASDAGGHTGVANLFTVADQLRLEIVRGVGGQLTLRFPTTAGRDYLLQTSDSLAPNSWVPFGSTIPGTGSVLERPIAANGRAFFRLQRTP